MTKEEIYIAALDNCLSREKEELDKTRRHMCWVCPYYGYYQCQNIMREDINKKINPDAFIAAGLIEEGYIKPYTGSMSVEIPYSEVSLKPTKEKTQRVKWLNDTYFTIPQKETKYNIYDKNDDIIYSASTIEDVADYINNLTIKKIEEEN